ncbi:S-layer homology domain-containing protein [Radiobacillus deserti]|uniref:S-layer homology domain-containing protein n=1 Tax=Radiobacillus deserti TaxID=2594883 RepID=A0A516KJN0_9BACI|nr:S-layer homology domain-containing protein [Radiobacillus deserti]QDP41587.1 S-layer homology domain-containing protein [Radiobacillus deserti]
MSKKLRKISVSTLAATAAVASVAPAVSADTVDFTDLKPGDSHYEAVQALVADGIIQGYTDGTFKPNLELTRPQAAVLLVKAQGLEPLTGDELKANLFSDVDADYVYAGYIAAAKKAGFFKGNADNEFGVTKNLSREQMASVLVNTLGLEVTNEADINLSNVSATHKNSVQALADNGITNQLSDFRPGEDVTRGQFATFLKGSLDAVSPAVVSSVKALNEKTLEVTGTGLKSLKAEDVTLSGNVVASIDANAAGTSATVTFQNGFPQDTEQTVKIGDKEFKFTYSFSVDSVSLDEKTFDDDTVGQVLSFKVNGLQADTEYLRQAGYTVNYVAVDNTGTAATDFFKGTNPSTSSTGLLNDEITVGNYTVEIQVLKDGKVVVSDEKTISISDLESTTTAVDSVELTTGAGVVLNSTTLVTGETADVTEVIGDAAGKNDVELPTGSVVLSSSNPSVVSVNNQTLTANVAGTAKVTVKVGNATKEISVTVASDARTVAKVTPSESTVKVVDTQTRTIDVDAVDQYGDPIQLQAADITEDLPENASSQDLVIAGDLITTLTGSTSTGYTIQGDQVGNGTILFKDANDKVVGQVAVQVTDVNNVGSTKVEHTIASSSVDYSLAVGDIESYQVSKFNTNGFYNGAETLTTTAPAATGTLLVEAADNTVASVTLAASGTSVDVEGLKAGKTDIVIKDSTGLVKHKFTVTVSASQVALTKVNFKSTATVDYVGKTVSVSDILDVRTDGANDPIVYGVEHNANTIDKVRLEDTAPALPLLYIDSNADGAYVAADDILLGAVTAEVLTGATGTNLQALGGTNIDLIPGSYTTAANDKGTILFRVLVDGSDANTTYETNEAVATTTLNVNVK